MNKNIKIVVFLLGGFSILNLIFAFNAGQKRQAAASKLDGLNAKLAEIDLRYKNAIQSYDALESELEETNKNLKDRELFSETLKETLQQEQKKTQALEEALNKAKAVVSTSTVVNNRPKPNEKPDQKKANGKIGAKTLSQAQVKKVDRTTRNW
jgi:predicted  nucleic acid-binding Zn-ribbon protein